MRPLFALLLLGPSLLAQTAGPIDARAMLESLRDIKGKQTASAKSQLAQTIGDFSSAASDDGAALNFYVEAVRITRFVGQDHADTAFRDWKKTEMAKLKPSAIRTALRYTTLSLQRAAGGTDDQMFPLLLAYTEDAQAVLPALEGAREQHGGEDQGILKQPVADNIFSRWYNLAGQLGALDNWEPTPANIDGIYQKILLPVMRRNRNPRILRYWDNKIISERGRASTETAAFETDRFNLTRRPALLWSRAEDEVVIGMRDQGISDMYALVKAFPGHPDAGKWISELENLLTTGTTAATVSTPPPAAAAPARPPPRAPEPDNTPIPGT